ncbi:hypothetical protein LPJ66_005248 [Kickxella alabastrina]|uniref:Uncharacterized protein n=1 Tax=Kickxella alabastrina TaxID=61397 RepID=A0ACC1IJE5_9FUNG|nr:hypothetical protein LPJ66_005248 [Kickxella alabastrina]
MSNHASYPHATDQDSRQLEQHLDLLAGYAGIQQPAAPLTSSSTTSPQFQASSVAPINALHTPLVPILDNSPSSAIYYSSTVTHRTDCAVYCIDQTKPEVMEQKVRQFYASDGASFIEHVPGHCLVFIPNSTNVNHMLNEMRKVSHPKRKAKPAKDKSNKSSKPTNAFIKYRSHKISDMKTIHPEISQTEISRMAGEFWKTEPEELKNSFRRKYVEEKRVYDMNKAKTAKTQSEAGSDAEALSDMASVSSMQAVSSLSEFSHPELCGGPNGMSGIGLSLGLGVGSDGSPVSFNTGRRRSHTLPPGGFSRSGAKRRISQELRKHLANKKTTAYMTAANANANSSININMFSDTMQKFHQQNQNQQMQPQYEFTFTTPNIDSCAPSSTIGTNSPSYLSCDTSSPMMMPLNPNFPLAEFTTNTNFSITSGSSAGSPNSMHQHTRSLNNISSAPLSINTPTFAPDAGFESFVPSPINIAKSLTDSNLGIRLPMVDTSGLNVFNSEHMPINAFSAGYTSSDPNSWPIPHAYTMMPDNSGAQQQQQQHHYQHM